MRWLAISVALLALVLVVSGCGGGDDEAASDTPTLTDTTTDETTTDDTTTDETTTDEETTDDTDLSGVFADEDCRALVAAVASFGQAFADPSGSSDENSAEFEELAGKVPEEIEADVKVLADAYSDYAAELQDIGIDAGQTPSAEQVQQLQAALASFNQQGVAEASERLSAWAQTNCPNG
ncbi:hypothetical protein BH20ACT14_BH20ACT14_07470 [soil metagenome]|nr:hypothetical protein [Actinomycetota bacterium]